MPYTNPFLFKLIATIGIFAFFSPWFTLFSSPFSCSNYRSMGILLEINNAWFLYLLPVSFFLSVLFSLKNIPFNAPIFIKIIEFIPLVLVLFIIVRLYVIIGDSPVSSFASTKLPDSFLIGFYLSIISSVLLIFSPLKGGKLIVLDSVG